VDLASIYASKPPAGRDRIGAAVRGVSTFVKETIMPIFNVAMLPVFSDTYNEQVVLHGVGHTLGSTCYVRRIRVLSVIWNLQ
jgi:hypothetical protein